MHGELQVACLLRNLRFSSESVLTVQSVSHFFRLFIAVYRYTIRLIKHSEEMK